MATAKTKIGIALGAGGARGLAHIGVIKSLLEHRIPIDYIAGTSSGAIIGAMYAATLDIDWVYKRISRFIHSSAYKSIGLDKLKITHQPNASIFQSAANYMKEKIIINIANDRLGIIKQDRLHDVIRFMLPVDKFEELKLPFSCTSLDLNSGRDIIFDSGDLVDALSATAAIPGFIPPIEKNGMLLTDGGVSCPIPVRTLQRMGADFRIAVNVGQKSFKKLNSPNLLQILGRAEQISTTRLSELKLNDVDIALEPDTLNVFWSEFDRLEELFKSGEIETQKNINRIKQALFRRKGIRAQLKNIFGNLNLNKELK
jgi:NTE family protein